MQRRDWADKRRLRKGAFFKGLRRTGRKQMVKLGSPAIGRSIPLDMINPLGSQKLGIDKIEV